MATNRARKVAKKILESKGEMPVSKAMLLSGYPATTAKNPQQLTKSIGWKQLMDVLLPDDKLLLRHAEGLDATKIHTSHTEPDREVSDYAVRKQYVELGYKLKKYLSPDNQLSILNQGEQKIIILDGSEANYDELRKQNT